MNVNIGRPPYPGGPEHETPVPESTGAEEPSKPPPSTPVRFTMPHVKPRQPAATLVEAALKDALARVQAADPEARRDEPEGIHRLRTSMRRLRSELQTVAELLDPEWCTHLEGELKWISGMLGSVRDVDILCQRLRAAITKDLSAQNGQKDSSGQNGQSDAASPDHPDRLEGLFDDLRRRHDANSAALKEAMEGERYGELIETLEASNTLPIRNDAACQPCRKVLPPLAAETWRRLRKKARVLQLDDPDAAFHEVRKRAKRARYSAELIASALGQRTLKQARRFVKLTTQIQDTLGEHQDAIVAAAELERYVAEHPDDSALLLTANKLIEAQHRALRPSREKFFDLWRKLDRKKTLRWLKAPQKAHS
jgi:CHAD domain-containing protein